MRITYSLLLLCFVSAILSCKQPIEANNKTIIAGKEGMLLDSMITAYLIELRNSTDNNAGLAIAVTNGDEIIYARNFGYENIELGIEADFNTLFHIASLSKPFTAVAALKLIQQGKLNLEDKIVNLIPEFKMKGNEFEKITVKHLLTHSSGIPRHVSANDWLNPKPLDANLEFAQQFELDFEPNSQFSYSNSAFDILGIVISRASGMSFTNYVRKHVLEPCGMTNSIYDKPLAILPKKWAVPYSYGLETQEWTPYPHADNYAPSSGLQTTLLDMCKWGIMHSKKGLNVLNSNHFELLTMPHYDTPWGEKIGLSWFLQSYLDRPIIMHSGQDTGFESIQYIYPESEISIVVMANRDFSRTGRIINAISECLFHQTPKLYRISAIYKFSEAYNQFGIEKAKHILEELKKDTSDIYYVNNYDILTTGAVLENGKSWNEAKLVLE